MDNSKPPVDIKEFAAAQEQAKLVKPAYVHYFSKGFTYNGKTIATIKFDFDQLTGRDGLAIEREVQQAGRMVVAPAFSGDYLIRMASRASDPKIGIDAFDTMSLSDYNRIRDAARSFLLKSES